MRNYIVKHHKFLLGLCILVALSGFVCILLYDHSDIESTKESDPSVTATAPERRLLLNAEQHSVGWVTIPADQLGGNFPEDITYQNVSNVTIEVDGTVYPLEEAIRDGHITVEEIFAYARIDARNGICRERHTTRNGLTYFIYSYPWYDIRLSYDVYETPDAQQHLISYFGIYNSSGTIYSVHHDDEGNVIDREDWGLTFTAVSATPTTLTYQCQQAGGQQIGALFASFYTVFAEDMSYVVPIKEIISPEEFQETALTMNGTCTNTIDWSEFYGKLPSGNYILRLQVSDVYDESQVHPLMKNFYDHQYYDFPFTIP